MTHLHPLERKFPSIMPYQVEVLPEYIHIRLSGRVTSGELADCLAEITELESTMEHFANRLTDLTDLEAEKLDVRSLEATAELRKSKTFPNPYKSAIVAPRDIQYGFSRMYEMLSQNESITMRVFREKASALDWLSQKEGFAES